MDIEGQSGEIRFTLEVKRAESGVTETVEMVGYIDQPYEQYEQHTVKGD